MKSFSKTMNPFNTNIYTYSSQTHEANTNKEQINSPPQRETPNCKTKT